MSKRTDRLDAVLAELAPVRDDGLVGEVRSPAATALLQSILETPMRGRSPAGSRRPRGRVFALAAAVLVAAVLSIPAFGVGPEIVSFLTGARDPDAPIATGSDIVVASGEAGVPWKLIATKSDQGLCLGLFYRVNGDTHGPGCGYLDIRGDLPPDVRGDPAAKCIGPRTKVAPGGTLVPCGSLPRRWIGAVGKTAGNGLDHVFAAGTLAEEVASVELVLNDGRTVRAHVVERPGGLPLDVYWAAWPCPLRPAPGTYEPCSEEDDLGADVKIAVARDASGRVLERRVPAWNGNPTGDPGGPPPPVDDGSNP
jgi:hypothetical protein